MCVEALVLGACYIRLHTPGTVARQLCASTILAHAPSVGHTGHFLVSAPEDYYLVRNHSSTDIFYY